MRGIVLCLYLLAWADGAALVYGQSRTAHQQRTAHWIFGNGFHVQFSDSVIIRNNNIEEFYSFQGGSTISDEQGDLLFYTNSQEIWNSNNEILLGGDSISTGEFYYFGSSQTQGSIILPLYTDFDTLKYILFNVDEPELRLNYSMIDMSLDSGLGGVDHPNLRLPVVSIPVSEQLMAIKHANGRDWWLLFRSMHLGWIARTWYSALIDETGIKYINEFEDLYVSAGGGQLVASDDGSRLAMTSFSSFGGYSISYFGFDRCTGQIYFIDSLSPGSNVSRFYGVGFGNDNSTFYVSAGPGIQLLACQFAGMKLECQQIYNAITDNRFNYSGGSMAKQGDCIYFVNTVAYPFVYIDSLAFFLSRICISDEFDTGVELEPYFLYLGEPNFTYSLPNFPNYNLGPLVGSPCDTLSPPDTTQVGLPVFSSPPWSWSVTPTVSGSSFQVSSSQPARLVVHDLYGRELLSMDCAGQCGFDLIDHPAGWYIVSMTDRSGQRSEARKVLWQP